VITKFVSVVPESGDMPGFWRVEAADSGDGAASKSARHSAHAAANPLLVVRMRSGTVKSILAWDSEVA
jgi:hypothetical protein